ncbi:hypothetical protein CRUP_017630 [Coryphaenoides rupestris]|nr:hypothetical protein CRUP_017630 [Coryphaenoides rupestris]
MNFLWNSERSVSLMKRFSFLASSTPLAQFLNTTSSSHLRSRLEYCLDRALRSPSPFPRPPRAGSNVGLAAVVILGGCCVV